MLESERLPVIPALKKRMQGDEDFKVILGHAAQASLDYRKLSQTKQTWSAMDTGQQALGLQGSVPRAIPLLASTF